MGGGARVSHTCALMINDLYWYTILYPPQRRQWAPSPSESFITSLLYFNFPLVLPSSASLKRRKQRIEFVGDCKRDVLEWGLPGIY